MTNSQWHEWLGVEVWQSSSFRGKALLSIGCAAGFVLAWWAAVVAGFPPGRDGWISGVADACLLHQSPPWPGLLMMVILIPALVAAGGAIAGSVRHDAGLFVAGFSMCAMSQRGGTMRITLIDGSGPSVLLLLGLEVVILYAIVIAARRLVGPMQRLGLVVDDALRDQTIEGEATASQKAMALTTSVLAMIVVQSIFATTDSKHQVIAAVFIAAGAASFVARAMYPVDDSLWYFLAPAAVALIGYLAGCVSPSGFAIGQLDGLLSPLGRALPLDYAGAGLCGSILGYWIARRWQRPMEDGEDDK